MEMAFGTPWLDLTLTYVRMTMTDQLISTAKMSESIKSESAKLLCLLPLERREEMVKLISRKLAVKIFIEQNSAESKHSSPLANN